MKKTFVLIMNILLVGGIMAFVVLYSRYENEDAYRRQIEHFENATASMEQVTDNYLEGEQRICDVWAQYINKHHLSLTEAAAFIRDSHVLKGTSAHIIDVESLTGLSTRPRINTEDDYAVSYERLGLFDDISWISEIGESINVSRAYTNPVNGEQSLAFCNRILLREESGEEREETGENREEPEENQEKAGGSREALLLRVIPVSELEEKWVFSQEEYKDAQLSMIDAEGSYIIKGKSFKNSGFFEFYKSYNTTDAASLEALISDVTSSATGSITMLDSRGRECVVTHTPVAATEGWTLLGLARADELFVNIENWLLIGVVAAALLILFVIDLIYMQTLNRRLQETARVAEAASRAKTDFLSTMSHDIRTPMNAIIGLTVIAEKNLGDTEAVGENLRKISLASNHLLTLINDILDISKVESGKLTLSPRTFSIVETVENLVNLSQPMVREKNIDFSFRINGMETEYLYADQLRLNQIYINILSNAIKYTEPGGRVGVDMAEGESPAKDSVRLTYIVSDSGIGMTPEFMEKMYQPFSRQTDSRVNSIQGTGLGLAITKQMVDLMGGTIECASAPGKGTTFTITMDIPRADRQLEELVLEPMDALLVDDDEILLETAVDTLTSLGVTVESASGGLEALGMITHRHEEGRDYRIVIIDWKMPDLDGLEAIRRIRSEVGDSLPILLISAYDWSDIEDLAREAGASGFISKPLFRSTLYNKINELLGTEVRTAEVEDDYSDLAGMNILVAEDNDVNWEIISAILTMYGITSERAENGRICVEMLKAAEPGRYGLIFMDVQMPEMNGLEATRAIRKMEDPGAASIPIIAMTADAFSENVAECLEAGMDGHIAKPVDVKLVIKEIRRIKERSRG